MIDIGWSELLIIAVIMIVVVGPKDLPAVLRTIGKMTRKVRGMADEFRRGMDDFVRESELNDLKDSVDQVRNFNLNHLKSETERQIKDATGGIIDPGKPAIKPASGKPAAKSPAAKSPAAKSPAAKSKAKPATKTATKSAVKSTSGAGAKSSSPAPAAKKPAASAKKPATSAKKSATSTKKDA